MARGHDVLDRDLLELLEARAINVSCPAGVDELDVLDPQIERLREQLGEYFQDAPAQPIAEWRDLVLGATLATFDGDFDLASDLCDRGGEIGDVYWGESSFALHAMGLFFIDLVSAEWTRSRGALELIASVDSGVIFVAALALAQLHAGDREIAEQHAGWIARSGLRDLDEHILGGNALIAAAELALALDHDSLAEVAEAALAPYESLVMGVPWACSLAAADPLARLAERRGGFLCCCTSYRGITSVVWQPRRGELAGAGDVTPYLCAADWTMKI